MAAFQPGKLSALYRVNVLVAVVMFAALTLVVSLQVLTRFVLHQPMIWSEEVARFLFFWTVLLGAAMSVRNRRHFVIDVTGGRRERMGPISRFLFDIIPDLCIIGFCLLLLVQGIGYTRMGMMRTATNSQINMALVYAAIPVFAGLSIVYATANLLADWRAFRRGEPATAAPVPEAE
jgi:TRAP-type C4-dicarboxylate transport system permease small subunit